MTSILIVEKSGSIKTLKAKDVSQDTLYKKAGFKTNDGFGLQTTWSIPVTPDKTEIIELYGKTKGKAGQENKYDFPPPVDSTLFFGACVLVQVDGTGKLVDLSEEVWNKAYEYLFGGFEDLGDEDSEEELDTDEELEILAQTGAVVQQTKQGYVKDGFIVDSDEDFEEEDPSEESEEEYVAKPAKKRVVARKQTIKVEVKKVAPKKGGKKSAANTETTTTPAAAEPTNTYLDCTSELTEEKYV